MNTRRKLLFAARRGAQAGASLIIALVALAGLSVAGAAMMRSADTATLVVGSLAFQETAAKATERAIETAIAGVTALSVAQREANQSSVNYFAAVEFVNLEPSTTRLTTTMANAVADTATGNTMRYAVERLCSAAGTYGAASCVMQDGLPVYRVTAVAVGPRFSSETAQTFFTVSEPLPACGVQTQQLVTISGQSHQHGAAKCYHSNSNLQVSGTVQTAGVTAYAVGTVTDGGGGILAANEFNGSPSRSLPAASPATHKGHATLVFQANGNCGSGAGSGTRNCTGFPSGAWSYDNGSKLWKQEIDLDGISGAIPAAGLYYFETNVMFKKLGRTGALATMTIISDMSIQMPAEVHLRDFSDAAHPTATNQIFILAAGDLELPGQGEYLDDLPDRDGGRNAMIIAKAELKINGDTTAEAGFVARNEALPANANNLATENTVSGTLHQTYDGDGGGAAATPARLRWRLLAR
jgi:type IV pilus assembly protein PilX